MRRKLGERNSHTSARVQKQTSAAMVAATRQPCSSCRPKTRGVTNGPKTPQSELAYWHKSRNSMLASKAYSGCSDCKGSGSQVYVCKSHDSWYELPRIEMYDYQQGAHGTEKSNAMSLATH
jgi:hypothetical protein